MNRRTLDACRLPSCRRPRLARRGAGIPDADHQNHQLVRRRRRLRHHRAHPGSAMQEKFGQNVIVENRPGAGGVLGNEVVANAPKDGYTLGVQTAGQIIASTITKNMRYDPVGAFDWIGQIATAGLFMVVLPDSPYKDIKSLVAAAKANPGKITFGSPGFAATQHLAGELFKQSAGVDMLHVPYKSTPEVLAALLSKNVDVVIDTITVLLGQVQAGSVRALAVTGKDRFPTTPDIPPVVESGVVPNYDVYTWYGMYGPKGMPPAVIAKLNKTLNEMIEEPAIRERLVKIGVVVQGSTPDYFAQVHGVRAQEVVRRPREGRHGAEVATQSGATAMITRRNLLAASAAAALAPGVARAQTREDAWPARHVRLIVPFPPGGGTDNVGRILSARLSARSGASRWSSRTAAAAAAMSAAKPARKRRRTATPSCSPRSRSRPTSFSIPS